MRRHQAIEQITEAEDIGRRIENARKDARYPDNNLKFWYNEFKHVLDSRDHGERDALWVPFHRAGTALKDMDDKFTEEQWESAFSTVQRTLLSIVRKYVRAMRSGVQELYPE